MNDTDIRESLVQAAREGVPSRIDVTWRVRRKLAHPRASDNSPTDRERLRRPLIALASILLVLFVGGLVSSLQVEPGNALPSFTTDVRPPFASRSAPRMPQVVSTLSADASRAAFVTPDGTVVILDLRANKKLQTIALQNLASGKTTDHLPSRDVTWLALDARGSVLAIRVGAEVTIWDVDQAGPASSLKLQPDDVLLALSPDGRWLAIADFNSGIEICDTRSGRRTALLEGRPTLPVSLVFRPDGKQLILVSLSGEVRHWAIPQPGWEITIQP